MIRFTREGDRFALELCPSGEDQHAFQGIYADVHTVLEQYAARLSRVALQTRGVPADARLSELIAAVKRLGGTVA